MNKSPSAGPGWFLPPGSTIGILGGGQLGRMSALAAARLGYRTHVFTPEIDSPCAQVSTEATLAAYDDEDALTAFAGSVDVITLEFENVPVAAAEFLGARKPFMPSASALSITQVRTREKTLINQLGFATAPWRAVSSLLELEAALVELGRPAVLKTNRMGYDGKGQIKVTADHDPLEIWRAIGSNDTILEGYVDFARELSVVLARGRTGDVALYPAVENRHRDHILFETLAPAKLSPSLADLASHITASIADALDFVGVLAIELFETTDGRLLVNEIAPRPHNSGHWTIEGAATSQFEQQVRAVCGLPLGSTAWQPSRMLNLIGDDALAWQDYLADPAAHLHLYGKNEIRPGRKMGHVTWTTPYSAHEHGKLGEEACLD